MKRASKGIMPKLGGANCEAGGSLEVLYM